MFFSNYKIYENKLSEKIQADTLEKKKLIEMETPKDKSPIYSFISISLLIYVWIFQISLLYKQSYGYLYSLVFVIFTTICFFLTYKKSYLANNNQKYVIIGNIILVITFFLSFKISLTDIGKINFWDIGELFLFFIENNNKSYLALCTLSSLTLGIVLSYFSCTYEIYRAFYSESKRSKDKTFEQILRLHYFFSFLFIAILPSAINLTFNPCTDSFNFMLKMFSFAFFSMLPPWYIIIFQVRKYLKIYEHAKISDY